MAKKKAKRTTKRRATKKHVAKRKPAISRPNKKRGRGKPMFEPTAEQRAHVETLAGFGLKQDEIRQLVTNPATRRPISDDTLRRHFAAELARGAPLAAANIAKSIYRKGIGDGPQAVTAAIWFSKCRMGWKERVSLEVDVKSGVLVPPPSMMPEEWIKSVTARAVGKVEPGTEEKE